MEDFERYFDFERPDKYHFIVKEIYKSPKIGLENGFFYKTVTIPVKCSKEDYNYLMQCRKWAGECWNAIVEADKHYYEENKKFMNRSQLQLFVKGLTPLHAAGNQHIYLKYFTSRDAMFRSRKAGHKNSNKVELPYKNKKYFVVGWNVFSFE